MSNASEAYASDRYFAEEAAKTHGGCHMQCSNCGDVCLRPFHDEGQPHQPCFLWTNGNPSLSEPPGTWHALPEGIVERGCWVETPHWGEALVLKVKPDGWVSLRYEATRRADNATIWVLNSERLERLVYLRPPDAKSTEVLALEGPYGAPNPDPHL